MEQTPFVLKRKKQTQYRDNAHVYVLYLEFHPEVKSKATPPELVIWLTPFDFICTSFYLRKG